jgi:isopenicillin N synthase-like dioxygenase
MTIPVLDITPLLEVRTSSRDALDQQLGQALEQLGAAVLTGLPEDAAVSREKCAVLNAFFDHPIEEKMALALNRTEPSSKRMWRGYMNHRKNDLLLNEMYDVGREPPVTGPNDFEGFKLVAERTPFPEHASAAWHEARERYYAAYFAVSLALVRSIARYLRKEPQHAEARFADHNSTLRLLNYPLPPAGKDYESEAVEHHEHEGQKRAQIGMPHTDAAGLSFLWQTPGGGLQAQDRQGHWQDVPRVSGAVSVHCGESFGLMTANRMPATPHRVLSTGQARQAVGFFLEPGIGASVDPWPDAGDPDPKPEPDRRYGPWILKRYGYI